MQTPVKTEQQGWARVARLILYHSQSTSARTLFLRHASGSVITPEALPPLSTVFDEGEFEPGAAAVFLHPAALVSDYCAGIGLPTALLQAEGEFHERVDTPQQTLSIYLARFTCIDPPRELFAGRGGRFCAITELRGAHPAEMVLLQRAYQAIMG
jgi:hypothetical protein